MESFIKRNYDWICLSAAIIFVAIFCFASLTVKPRLWFDEGLNIEAARNLLLFQKINIQLAPGVFADTPVTLVTTGFPLLAPLAAFFYFFGFGIFQARLLMLILLILALIIIFLLAKSFFGKTTAIFTGLFAASFAPFYANGLTVMGEIPGFIFLLAGLYFLIKDRGPDEKANKYNYILTGLFWGLAAATKPSIYLLLLPAFFIYLLFERQKFFPKLIKFTVGALPPLILQAAIIVPRAFSSLSSWQAAIKIYQNPYVGAPSLSQNIFNNLKSIFSQTTLIYFGILIIFIIFAFTRRSSSGIWRRVFLFYCIYGSLILIYFLRSPGWLRYLLPLELLTFIFIFPAINIFLSEFDKFKHLAVKFSIAICAVLISIQLFNLFFKSDIFSSASSNQTIEFLNQKPLKTADFINIPQVAAFYNPAFKYQMISDIKQFGKNPLSFSRGNMLEYIIFKAGDPSITSSQNILDRNYNLAKEFGSYQIYQLK